MKHLRMKLNVPLHTFPPVTLHICALCEPLYRLGGKALFSRDVYFLYTQEERTKLFPDRLTSLHFVWFPHFSAPWWILETAASTLHVWKLCGHELNCSVWKTSCRPAGNRWLTLAMHPRAVKTTVRISGSSDVERLNPNPKPAISKTSSACVKVFLPLRPSAREPMRREEKRLRGLRLARCEPDPAGCVRRRADRRWSPRRGSSGPGLHRPDGPGGPPSGTGAAGGGKSHRGRGERETDRETNRLIPVSMKGLQRNEATEMLA